MQRKYTENVYVRIIMMKLMMNAANIRRVKITIFHVGKNSSLKVKHLFHVTMVLILIQCTQVIVNVIKVCFWMKMIIVAYLSGKRYMHHAQKDNIAMLIIMDVSHALKINTGITQNVWNVVKTSIGMRMKQNVPMILSIVFHAQETIIAMPIIVDVSLALKMNTGITNNV